MSNVLGSILIVEEIEITGLDLKKNTIDIQLIAMFEHLCVPEYKINVHL